MTPDYTHLFKVVVVGDSGVGKSNLLTRYVRGSFDSDSRSTIGVEFFSKMVKSGESVAKLQLWDTAGQERYRAVTTAYYRGAGGAVVVYDVSRPETFHRVSAWVEEVGNNCSPLPVLVLVGNKADLAATRSVSTAAGLEVAKKHNMCFFEASALNGKGVEEAFEELVGLMIKADPPLLSKEESPPYPAGVRISLEEARSSRLGGDKTSCSC